MIHGHAKGGEKTRAYRAWCDMKQRCSNRNKREYKYYGAIGVKVCDRWKDSFINFLGDMGEPSSPDLTLDRYPDNCGNYEPGNCRWATWQEQRDNLRPRSVCTQKANNAEVLNMIVALYSHGNSIQEISDDLNRKRIPSPRGGKW